MIKVFDQTAKPGRFMCLVRVDKAWSVHGPYENHETAEGFLLSQHMKTHGAVEGLVAEVSSQFRPVTQVARVVRHEAAE